MDSLFPHRFSSSVQQVSLVPGTPQWRRVWKRKKKGKFVPSKFQPGQSLMALSRRQDSLKQRDKDVEFVAGYSMAELKKMGAL